MAEAAIRASEVTERITIRVRGIRVLRWRLWLASKIFRLGAAVAGCGILIEPPSSD